MAATTAVKAPKSELPAEIAEKLKATPEQQQVVGPIVQYLVSLGWTLDHLFFDHQPVPTFVETKRSSDLRARREVVAQMLDYASSATDWSRDL